MASSKKDEIILDGRDLISSITIGVKMPRTSGLRMTVATWLFRMAGLVSGMNVVVEVDGDER